MSATYDGIVIGAGHNSLVLQAYAARAGLSTICLERLPTAGGGLRTEEFPPGSGFLHNTHSFFHRAITEMPWFQELELERHGAEYIHPDLNVVLLTRDQRHLEWWTNFDKTAESVSAFSPRDAETLCNWRDQFRPILKNLLIPFAQSPPLPPDEYRRRLEQTHDGRRLLEVSCLSPLQFVEREFEHPVVQAGMLFFNGLREVDLRLPGFGHHIPSLLASDTLAQMCRGGAAGLAAALISAVREAGGDVLTRAEPRRILVRNGRAVGVETQEGEIYEARRFVASGLNPQQTFLELIDEGELPASWVKKVRGYAYNVVAPLFAVCVNLSEPPYYVSRGGVSQTPALMTILGLEDVGQFAEIVRHHEAGTVPPTVMWGACPTQFDPSQAPAGQHTAFMWEKLPYALQGDAANWEQERARHADRMWETWCRYAPNLPSVAFERFARSPRDTARLLLNMRDGDLLVGTFAHDQVGFHRPFPGAGHYRGHLAGLYLCGSCCHPGGNITGLPGYNCAQVLLADLAAAF